MFNPGTMIYSVLKKKATEKLLDVGLKVIKKSFGSRGNLSVKSGVYSVFESGKKMDKKMANVKNGLRRVQRFDSTLKGSLDPFRTYRNIKGWDKDIKISKNMYKMKDVNLYELDKRIFEISQSKSFERGVISKSDIMKDEEFAKQFSRIQKSKEKKAKGFEFGKYDANVVFREFKEKSGEMKSLTNEELLKTLEKRYGDKDPKRIEKDFKLITTRIEKNVQAGNIEFNPETKEYKITPKGIMEAEKVKKTFEFTEYDSEVIFKYIEDNGGKITPFELEKALNNEYEDISYISKQLDYLTRRMDNNVKAGYLENKDGAYSISKEGAEKKASLVEKNTAEMRAYLDKKFEFFEKRGLLNKRDEMRYEVTEDFLESLKDLIKKAGEEKNGLGDDQVKTVVKNGKEFRFGEADVRIFRMIDQEEGLSVTDVKLRAEDKKREVMIIGRMKKLEEKGFIKKVDGKYQKTEDGIREIKSFFKRKKTEKEDKIKAQFEFTKFDKGILNKSKSNYINLDKEIKAIEKRYEGVVDVKKREKEIDRQTRMLKGRCEKLEVMGYLEKYKNGYRLTEKAQSVKLGDKLKELKKDESDIVSLFKKHSDQSKKIDLKGMAKDEDFERLFSKSFESKIKRFEFGKYDARLFDIFKDGKLDVLDYKIKLAEKSATEKELEKEFRMFKGRMDKNVQAGNVVFDKQKEVYEITAKGHQEVEHIKKDLKLLDYDSETLFEYAKRNDNKLSFYKLKNEVLKECANDQEYKKKFFYAKIRLDKNVEMGYVKREGNTFSVTEKGLAAVEEKSKSAAAFELEKKQMFLERNMERFERIGIVEKGREDFKLIESFDEIWGEKAVKEKEKFVFGIEDVKTIDGYFSNNRVSLRSVRNDVKKEFFGEKGEERFKAVKERLDKCVEYKYMSFDKKTHRYSLTTKGMDKVRSTMKDEIRKHDPVKIKEDIKSFRLDEKVLKEHIEDRHKSGKYKNVTVFNDDFDISEGIKAVVADEECVITPNIKEDANGFIVEREFEKPIGYDSNGRKLKNLRIVMDDEFNVKTAFPTKRQLLDKYDLKLDKYKLTKFDFENIARSSKDGVWSEKSYADANQRFDRKTMKRKTDSVKKRLETLEELNLVKREKDGYVLKPKFLEREKRYLKDKEHFLSSEQEQVLSEIKTFLNFTDSQIADFVYKDDNLLSKVETKELVKKGYLGEAVVDLDHEGGTNVYYLTPKGKQKINNIESYDKKIYDSKVHNRPEELKHDLLVYSAYKDIEQKLAKDGCQITKVMTDKDIRAEHRRLELKEVEFSDLYVEFEDVKTKEKGFVNIEVDCGYKPNVVENKAKNIENLVWYTDSQKQAQTISKYAQTKKIVVVNLI